MSEEKAVNNVILVEELKQTKENEKTLMLAKAELHGETGRWKGEVVSK